MVTWIVKSGATKLLVSVPIVLEVKLRALRSTLEDEAHTQRAQLFISSDLD